MIPTESQWSRWSLISKYTAISLYIGVFCLLVTLTTIILNVIKINAIDYVDNVNWNLDTELTQKNLPENLKEAINHRLNDRDRLLEIAGVVYGNNSEEYLLIKNTKGHGVDLFMVLLNINQGKLKITNDHVIFSSSKQPISAYKASTKNADDCSGSFSLQSKNISAGITNVSRSGITFEIPDIEITDNYNCQSEKSNVKFLPGLAQVEGSTLKVQLPNGFRYWEVKDGIKTVKRERVFLYYSPE